MESHRHLLVLVGVLLAATATAAAAAAATAAVAAAPAVASVCNPSNIAQQVNLFCPYENSRHPCCDVVKLVMDAGHDSTPPCLCQLDDYQDFLVTGYALDDLLDIYRGCGGEQPGDAQHLVDSCVERYMQEALSPHPHRL